MLSARQELILQLVVDAYLASARPVPSKEVAERPEVAWGPSTVRSELALLEAEGYLTHPHTSAGRVPTDVGYRRYVDLLMESGRAPGRDPGRAGALAAASRGRRGDAGDDGGAGPGHRPGRDGDGAAARRTATIHRVEVLRLTPTKVVVIAIASTGDVARRVFEFERPVDPGLVEWASSYLNESLTGLGVGSRMIAGRLADPELDRIEAEFVATLGAAFTELEPECRRRPLHGRRLAPALRSAPGRPAAGR